MNRQQRAIQFIGLSKIFSTRGKQKESFAIRDFNLEVFRGEFLCLLGPSGCGKTTLLRCLAGFEHPTQGEIYLFGHDILGVPAHKRGIPMVFQNYALFPHMTLFDNLAYGLRVRKVPSVEIRRRVEQMMSQMGLIDLGHRYPDQLSGGQQQRVALGRALVLEPKILLFDEPLSNLDEKLRIQMRVEIKQLQQTTGLTCVYVTHDQEEAIALADRLVVMNEGRVVQIGTPEEICRRPASPFVADFMGNLTPLPLLPFG